MTNVKIGLIGGSGLYQMPKLSDALGRDQGRTRLWQAPSDAFIVGTLEVGERVAFLPRHGRGQQIFTPTELPFRANIYAMKSLGVERILSASAVGFVPTGKVRAMGDGASG